MNTGRLIAFRNIPEPVIPPPPQPVMHKVACKNCPSAHFPIDPESADIRTWKHEDKVDTAFPCGWSPVRYCRGYCEQMGITNDDLSELNSRRYIQP